MIGRRARPTKGAAGIARRRRSSTWVNEGSIEVSTEPNPLPPEDCERRVLLALGNLILKLQELDAKEVGEKQG